jgi:Glycosyltransferase 61
MVTRRSVCYLVLLGILILAGMRLELPQLRLPVIQVLYDNDTDNADADDEKRSGEATTDEATSTTAATAAIARPNVTAWCILDRNNTSQYFRHFPHALQSLAPCWSYVCRQREQQKEYNVRCGIYIRQPLRYPWEDMSSWTLQLLGAMGCRVVVQQQNMTEPFDEGDLRSRVPDRRVSHYSFFERKEDVQLLQAQVMGAAADAGTTNASGQPTKGRMRIGLLQRVRTRAKQPDRVFLNVPALRSALQSAFPDATVDETEMGGFSLKEQAAWWHQHDVVVAGHGAALTNSIFLRNSKDTAATVIEVFPDGFHPYIFGALMKSAGVHRLTIDTNASVARGKSSDLRPDPALVVRLVRQAIGGPLPEPETASLPSSAPPPPSPSPPHVPVVAYTRMRSDRSGAVVHDLLHAHAYCFAHNLTYGGSCAVDAKAKGRSGGSQLLVDFLGLSDELKLACPNPGSLSRPRNKSDFGNDSFVVLNLKQYKRDDLFTPKWLSYVNARRNITERTASTDDDPAPLQVVVYVRRGDVTPCVRGGSYWRYLPNSYYLRVLDHYLPPDRPVAVRIYSVSKSPAEDFAEFRRRNYTVLLDAPIGHVWEALMTADMAVISRSSFSYVPAIFNAGGTVLYTNFWQKPLPWWVRINQTIQQQGGADLRSLQDRYCPK